MTHDLPSRYLLCRPEGGLNDMLCQIGRCALYAARHQRVLVIDTEPTNFSDRLEHYLTPLGTGIRFPTPELLLELERLAVYPRVLQGRLNGYTPQHCPGTPDFVIPGSSVPLSFDFGLPYPEPLLVHHACGGGLQSLHALTQFRLKPELVASFAERMLALGAPFAGIHVRHTDYQSDYVGFFHSIAGSIRQDRIALCTDNMAVAEYALSFFRQRVFSFAYLPDLGGRPLHYGHGLDRRRINLDSFLDLLTLAKSAGLFVSRLRNGGFSGFSRLAASLQQSPVLLDQLLGEKGRPPRAKAGTV